MSGYYESVRRTNHPLSLNNVLFKGVYSASSAFPDSLDTSWSFRTKAPIGSPTSDQKALFDENRIESLRSKVDTGHPFWVDHSRVSKPSAVNSIIRPNPSWIGNFPINGSVYASVQGAGSKPLRLNLDGTGSAGFQDFPEISEINSAALSAMRKSLPTNSTAKLGQALAELLRDTPRVAVQALQPRRLNTTRKPETKSRARKGLKAAGNDYLNFSFGWAPLVNDVIRTCYAIVNSAQILDEFVKSSDVMVYRHVYGPAAGTNPTEVIYDYNGTPPGDSFQFAIGPKSQIAGMGLSSVYDRDNRPRDIRVTTHQSVKKTWRFSGAWTYFVEEDNSFLSNIRRFEQLANKLLGLRLTPELLWELAPWSWMVDWFSQVGDFISVTSALQYDSLVMQYGYLTFKTTQKTVASVFCPAFSGPDISVTTTYEASRLDRVRATPYGFGLKDADINASQWAILAALGFSRA